MHDVESTHGTEAPASPGGGQEPYFLVDTIEVKPEHWDRFVPLMEILRDKVFCEGKWKLISATRYVSGRPCTVMHLWEIPSACSLQRMMRTLVHDNDYMTLQDYIVSEQQHLLSRMRYDLNASEWTRPACDGATEALGSSPAGDGGGPPEVVSSRSST